MDSDLKKIQSDFLENKKLFCEFKKVHILKLILKKKINLKNINFSIENLKGQISKIYEYNNFGKSRKLN